MSNQKQKLAQLVMQKMKQKKQAQQRNRPHFQVLRLNIKFSLEQNDRLKEQITQLNHKLENETKTLQQLKNGLQNLQNTGKKTYPVIVIKPEFIASQNITSNFKQFFRKASNTFLKADMIRTQKYEIYMQKQQEIKQKIEKISSLETQNYDQQRKNISIMQQKRTKVLKQDIQRRKYIEQQNQNDQQMQRLRQENKVLLKQYEIKKENLQNRIRYSQNLAERIQEEKKKIQFKYNPVTYRQYLKKVFDIRIKNQLMEKNLISVISSLNQATKISEKYQKELQKKCSLKFLGRVSDSPSKKLGKIKKQLERSQQIYSNSNPKSITDIIDLKACTQKKNPNNRNRRSLANLQQVDDSRHLNKLIYRKQKSQRNHSSVKTLKSTLKSSAKTDRTLSTTFGLSTAKKIAVEID